MTRDSKNSPLEGWRTMSDGVEPKDWKSKSLFPYWELPKNKSLVEKAKELRKAGVLSEVIFWNTFKDKKLTGWDIDRQIIIGSYIVDFFIPELGLVFEIDGSTHDYKFDYDRIRDKYLQSLGLEIIHINDIEVKRTLDNVITLVTKGIKEREDKLKSNSTPSVCDCHPSRGEL